MRILHGNCLDVLPTLEAGSVQTCVTSPPYWGLRDYGVEGQLGLEKAPEEYVSRMVSVFREVRRVLREDGTLFLNLGDSYFGSTQTGGTGSKEGSAKRAGRMFSRAASRRDARLSGTAYTERSGSTAPDCAYSGLCGGCAAAESIRTVGNIPPHPAAASPLSLTGRDSGLADSAAELLGASPLASLASTTPGFDPPPPGQCSHCGNCGACLEVLHSSSRDGRLCARMAGYRNGNGSPASDGRSQGTDAAGMAWLNYTAIKPKDLVGIPWMVALALRADGWWLRSDIVWSKPNPMPESVTDRPTKAHEYLFLLTKAERYYYDAEAIKEPPAESVVARAAYMNGGRKLAENSDRNDGDKGQRTSFADYLGGRNRRSVWTIATQPFPEAHFAVMPEALVEPCILAGSKPGDLVLDPFAGSGTVGKVALRHGRRFVGVELNPQYVDMAKRRMVGPLFAEAATS